MSKIYSIIDEYGCAVTKAYKTEEKIYDEFLAILKNDPLLQRYERRYCKLV